MSNDEIMEILLKYDNLKELHYENNILTYNGKSIDISNIALKDFFESPYSQMYLDQRTISAQDFFNILELHTTKVIDNLNSNNTINDLEKMALDYLNNNINN